MVKFRLFVLASLSVVAVPEIAEAQRLLVINCDDGELRTWNGWRQVDTVTSEAFLAMSLPTIRTYDVLEVSHCIDKNLTSPAGKAKILTAVRQGLGLYATLYNTDTSWLPGHLDRSGTDTCSDGVTIPVSAQDHPIISFPNPVITDADLSNVNCALHGSFLPSADYSTVAQSTTTGLPVMLSGQFSCGRVFVNAHHYHSTAETRAIRFIDSVARYLSAGHPSPGVDGDGDGIDNSCDNCPAVENPAQSDCDGDGIGDACDLTAADQDHDGIEDGCDTCPAVSNPNQPIDTDGDGVDDACDNCPNVSNADQADCDHNNIGDACDVDSDGDRVPDACDNCPHVFNPLQQKSVATSTLGDSCRVKTLDFEEDCFDDVSLFESDPDHNNNFPSLQCFKTVEGNEKAAVMIMDLTHQDSDCPIVTPGSQVVRATLNIFQTVKLETTITYHFVLAPWTELGATWNNIGSSFDPTVEATHVGLAAENDERVDIDITRLVSAWVSGERPNYGWYMRTPTVGYVRFGATERGTHERRPRVFVDVIEPEPAVLLLVGTGPNASTHDHGRLYAVNAQNGLTSEIGLVGSDPTALATAPDGTVYASVIDGSGHAELATVDVRNGAAQVIAPMSDAGRRFTSMPDCTFRKSTLYCWTEIEDQAATVDIETGEVNLIGGGVWAYGSGLAADKDGTLYVAPHGTKGELYRLDPSTGNVSSAVRLRGGRENITAMTFLNGTLYAISDDDAGYDLVSIDPHSGAVATVGPLPYGADALTTLGYHP